MSLVTPTLLPRMPFGNPYSLDGASIFDNPTKLILKESRTVFRGQRRIIISIGSGKRVLHDSPRGFLGRPNHAFLSTLANPEVVDERMQEFAEGIRFQGPKDDLQYFRFNDNGSHDLFGSDEEQIHMIEQSTKKYLAKLETISLIESVRDALLSAEGECVVIKPESSPDIA